MAALVVGGAVAGPATAQTRCARDGHWLVCEDGRRYAIRLDLPEGGRTVRWRDGARAGRWRDRPETRPDGPAAPAAGESAPLISDDGLVCWPHGDHVHCR